MPGFQYYLNRTIADAVHSGNGRTGAEDDNTDYYLVPLSEDGLRPGTVYADRDADEVRDAGEVGIEGVRIELLDAGGRVIATTTSPTSTSVPGTR